MTARANMNLSDKELNALRQNFLFVYRDPCVRGMGEYDDDIVELLWGDFLADMRAGFPSIKLVARLT
jgi:hypothetical protein